MSQKKYTVKSGQGELVLSKSQQLVGLKAKKTKDLSKKNYVQEQFHKHLGGFNVVQLNKEGDSIDNKLDEVRTKKEIDLGTHVYLAEGSNRPLVPTGEIYIVYADGTNEEEQQLVLDEYHLKVVERRDPLTIIAEVTDKSPNPIKVATFLQQISLVQQAEPDLDTYVDEYFSPPIDQLFSHQWHLKNNGLISDANYQIKRGADAKVLAAWERLGNAGSSNITIAIVDNGFDTNHPDLRGKVVKPFDFWAHSSKLLQGDPDFTHGTPCASVALASVNGRGIVGAAPNSKFMPLSGTSYSDRGTEQIFDYAIKHGADIVSCSWGTTEAHLKPGTRKIEAIAKAARQGRNGKGCVVLFAVGNEGRDYVSYYAAHPDVIAVAASTSKDEHAPYSNRGREVTICAPSNGDWPIIAARASWDKGTDLRGPGAFRYWADGRSRGNGYKHFGGTSSATPLVAGICALMLSANPNLTSREVKEILIKTADKIGNSWEYRIGHSKKYGYGRVNALRAVEEALRRKGGSFPNTNTGGNTSNTGGGSPSPTPTPTPTPPSPTPSPSPSAGSGRGIFRFSVQRQAANGYGVQVGVFAEYGNVLIHVEKYERMFGEAVLVSINSMNGRTVYKVVIGAFNNRRKAERLQEEMRTKGVRGFVRSLESLQ